MPSSPGSISAGSAGSSPGTASGRGGSAIIADRNGVIIAREPEPLRYIGTKVSQTNIHLVQSQTSGTADIVSLDGTERIIGYAPPAVTSFGLYVSTGIARSEASAPIDRAVAQQHRALRARHRDRLPAGVACGRSNLSAGR